MQARPLNRNNLSPFISTQDKPFLFYGQNNIQLLQPNGRSLIQNCKRRIASWNFLLLFQNLRLFRVLLMFELN